MDTTIRNLDEDAYQALHTRASEQGRNVGDLLNEAMRALSRACRGRRPPIEPSGSQTRALSEAQRAFKPGDWLDRLWRPAVVIVFDSSFLIGFHNDRDAHHTAAAALMDR